VSTPAYTADVVLFARNPERVLCVLLIQRGTDSDALPGCWALPGGYLEPGENPEHAARRDLREETHLTAPPTLTFVDYYDTTGRDPRGPVVSTAYTALLDHMPVMYADDDARAARWVPVPLATEHGLAFDHDLILTDALRTFSDVIEGT
jgi:8-oxo-dGTP diphosphatase